MPAEHDWQKQGAYRVISVGKPAFSSEQPVAWDSEDSEFKAFYSQMKKRFPAKPALGESSNTLDSQSPTVRIAVLDARTNDKSYFSKRIVERHVVQSVAPKVAEAEAAAKRKGDLTAERDQLSQDKDNLEYTEQQARETKAAEEAKDLGAREGELNRDLRQAKVDAAAQRAKAPQRGTDSGPPPPPGPKGGPPPPPGPKGGPPPPPGPKGGPIGRPGAAPKSAEEVRIEDELARVKQDRADALETKAAASKRCRDLEKEPKVQRLQAIEEELRAVKPKLPGNHGTFCAAKAAWGSELIQIVGVQMQIAHGMSNNDPSEWRDALGWCLGMDGDGRPCCDIISCSAFVPYDGSDARGGSQKVTPSPAAVIAGNTDVLFIGSGGNDWKWIDAGERGVTFPAKAPNVLLVGGCSWDGKLNRISSAGDIDVWAPNIMCPQHAPDPTNAGGGAANDKTQDVQKGSGDTSFTLIAVETVGPPHPGQSVMDYGVSFGLPLVANVAAKCKLLNPALKGSQLADIIKSTAKVTFRKDGARWRDHKGQDDIDYDKDIVVRMVDPCAAYEEALARRQRN